MLCNNQEIKCFNYMEGCSKNASIESPSISIMTICGNTTQFRFLPFNFPLWVVCFFLLVVLVVLDLQQCIRNKKVFFCYDTLLDVFQRQMVNGNFSWLGNVSTVQVQQHRTIKNKSQVSIIPQFHSRPQPINYNAQK